MANLKIPALPGTIILVIIAITAGAFVRVYEKKQGVLEDSRPIQIRDETRATNVAEIKNNLSPIEESNYLPTLIQDWKTCTNEGIGFGIRYPKEWNILTKNSDGLRKEDCNNSTLIFTPNSSENNDARLEVQYIGNQVDIEEYMKENPSIFVDNPALKQGPSSFNIDFGSGDEDKLVVTIQNGVSPMKYISRGKEIFLISGSSLPDYYFTAFIYGLSFPKLKTDKSVSNWKSCVNSAYGFEVKYPPTWSIQTGDMMQGIRVIKDCGGSSISGRITFTSLEPRYSGQVRTGITITTEKTTERGSFKKILKETLISGEKVEWISREYGRFYHGNTRFIIEVQGDVADDTLDSFLNTFKFLN
jgi:hypothetical protein